MCVSLSKLGGGIHPTTVVGEEGYLLVMSSVWYVGVRDVA